jgi:hypothetical protein
MASSSSASTTNEKPTAGQVEEDTDKYTAEEELERHMTLREYSDKISMFCGHGHEVVEQMDHKKELITDPDVPVSDLLRLRQIKPYRTAQHKMNKDVYNGMVDMHVAGSQQTLPLTSFLKNHQYFTIYVCSVQFHIKSQKLRDVIYSMFVECQHVHNFLGTSCSIIISRKLARTFDFLLILPVLRFRLLNNVKQNIIYGCAYTEVGAGLFASIGIDTMQVF